MLLTFAHYILFVRYFYKMYCFGK